MSDSTINMASEEEIADQQELLAIHRRTLALYLKQQARHGEASVPPTIVSGILETRESIQRIKGTLRSWNVSVEDRPDDEELLHPQHTPQGSSPRIKKGTIVGVVVAVLSLTVALVFYFFYLSTPQQLTVHVANSSTGASVSRANVLLFFKGGSLSKYTDTNGTASFTTVSGKGETRLVVETNDNFEIFEREISLPYDGLVNVQLKERSGESGNVIVRVIDSSDGTPIPAAEVLLLVNGDIFREVTDSSGITKFTLSFPPNANIDAEMSIETTEYTIDYQRVTLLPNKIQDILLSRQTDTIKVSPFTTAPSTSPPIVDALQIAKAREVLNNYLELRKQQKHEDAIKLISNYSRDYFDVPNDQLITALKDSSLLISDYDITDGEQIEHYSLPAIKFSAIITPSVEGSSGHILVQEKDGQWRVNLVNLIEYRKIIDNPGAQEQGHDIVVKILDIARFSDAIYRIRYSVTNNNSDRTVTWGFPSSGKPCKVYFTEELPIEEKCPNSVLPKAQETVDYDFEGPEDKYPTDFVLSGWALSEVDSQTDVDMSIPEWSFRFRLGYVP